MAKVFVANFVSDTPQWNGKTFLLVTPEVEQVLVNNSVTDNNWSAVPKKNGLSTFPLGRYLECGYGTELPEPNPTLEEWVGVEVESIKAWGPYEDSPDILLDVTQ